MANATFLYLGTEQGLDVCSRPGTSKEWHITRRTLEGKAITSLARGDSFPVRLLAVAQGGDTFRSETGGRDWELVLEQNARLIAADPRDLETVFALEYTGDDPAPAQVYGSSDGGKTWATVGNTPEIGVGIVTMLVTPVGAGRVVWLGIEQGGVLYSKDDGASWQHLAATPDAVLRVRALVAASATEPLVYAACMAGLYHLRLDAAPELIEGNAPDSIKHLLLIGMIDKPGATALLAATDGGALWHSEDCGASWTELSGAEGSGLAAEDLVIALAAHPEYPDRAYLATASGAVFETANRGKRWAKTEVAAGSPVISLMAAVLK